MNINRLYVELVLQYMYYNISNQRANITDMLNYNCNYCLKFAVDRADVSIKNSY